MKNKHKNHIPAFTLLELVLNITVVGILMSNIYMGFNFFSKQLNEYQKLQEQTINLQQSYAVIEQDFFYCKEYHNTGSQLKIITVQNKSITYNILNDSIQRRINQLTETLPIKVSSEKFKTKSNLGIHALFLKVKIFNQNTPCVFINQQGVTNTINEQL